MAAESSCAMKKGLALASIIFAAFGAIHALRVLKPFRLRVGECDIPVAASGIATIFFNVLSFWLWSLRKS